MSLLAGLNAHGHGPSHSPAVPARGASTIVPRTQDLRVGDRVLGYRFSGALFVAKPSWAVTEVTVTGIGGGSFGYLASQSASFSSPFSDWEVALPRPEPAQSTTVVMEVGEHDVLVGDVVSNWKKLGHWVYADDKVNVTVTRIAANGGLYALQGGLEYNFHQCGGGVELFRVRRSCFIGLPQLTPSTPSTGSGKKTIADWPIACPKCARSESAVLLFQGYDCKHGCYK